MKKIKGEIMEQESYQEIKLGESKSNYAKAKQGGN